MTSSRNALSAFSCAILLLGAGFPPECAGEEGKALIVDGGFEAPPLSWGYWTEDKSRSRAFVQPGRDGNALCLENSDNFGRIAAFQRLKLEQAEPRPLVLRGWSRVLSCDAGTNLVKIYYSVTLDRIVYADGTKDTNSPYIPFDSGALDSWQFESCLIQAPKPIKSAELLCRWSNMQGRALFDSVSLGYTPYVADGHSLTLGANPELKAVLRNPSATDSFELRALVRTYDDGKETLLAKSGAFSLAPGGSEDLKLSCQAPKDARSRTVFIDLVDAATGELYFRRKSVWHGEDALPGAMLYAKDGVQVAELSPDLRIYPKCGFSGPVKKGISIAAAKGEFESVQLGLRLPSARNLKFAFSEFKDGKGATLDAGGFKIEYIDFVDVARTTSGYNPDSYPDKLVPSGDGSFPLPAGGSGLWLTFHVPREAVTGLYSGCLRVSGGLSVEIPIEVKALNFAMPRERDIALIAAFSKSDLLRALPDAYRSGRLAAPLYKDLEEHFADYVDLYYAPKTVVENGVQKVENAEDMAFCFEQLKGRDFKYMRLPIPMFGDASAATASWEGVKIPSPEFERRIVERARLFKEMAESHSCPQRLFYRAYDEPKDLKRLEYLCGLVRKALPDIPILSTSRLADKGEFEKFKDSIDIFCPHIIYMSDELERNREALERSKDRKLFLYHNHLLLLDYQRLNARALPLIAHHYGAKGIMLWSINAWKLGFPPEMGKASLPGYQYTEGVLLYPGKDRLLYSVRWQLLREGLEDFEYLSLLERAASGLADRPALQARAVKLLDDASKMVADWQRFSRDYEAYRKLHREVGAFLDEVSQ